MHSLAILVVWRFLDFGWPEFVKILDFRFESTKKCHFRSQEGRGVTSISTIGCNSLRPTIL